MNNISTFISAAVAATAIAGAANAKCGYTDNIDDTLQNSYGETVQSQGVSSEETGFVLRGSLLKVYGNIEDGSWTLVEDLQDGVSCLIASGQDYEEFDASEITRYGLALQSSGVAPGDRLVNVFADEASGEMAVVVYAPNSETEEFAVVAAGNDYQEFEGP